MPLNRYERVGDFSDDEQANKGGRSTVDTPQLDAELDAVRSILNVYATAIESIRRDDGLLLSDLIKGHEFSAEALTLLAAQIGTNTALVWRGNWVTAQDYAVGNLVHQGGSTYICVAAHTSGTFSTDLAAELWELFSSQGSSGFPGGATNNDVLAFDGANEVWSKVTTAMAPTLAPKASPVLTGVATLPAVKTSVPANNPSSGVVTTNFDTEGFWRTVTTGGNINTWVTSNRGVGKGVDVLLHNNGASEISMPFTNAGFGNDWVWIGIKPTKLAPGKKAILSLRCFGADETDVVAMWGAQA